MGTPRGERRSAAILFADAKGFSGAMERDETGTWQRITRSLSLFRKLVADYGGRIVNEPGDAILALFGNAADALKFGIEVQRELKTLPQQEMQRLILTLEEEMHEASAELRFEYAAKLRDEIVDLRRELRDAG